MKTFAILALLCVAAPAWAHKQSDAHLRLAVAGGTITGRLDVSVKDLDAAISLDASGDGDITWGELTAAAPRIAAYVTSRLDLGCPMQLGAAGLVDLTDGAYWSLPLTAHCSRPPTGLDVTYKLLFDIDAQHRGLVHVGTQTVIIKDAAPVHITLGARTSILAFVGYGIWHIWMGLDHILFLACLVLPAVYQRKTARWQAADSLRDVITEVFEIVTAFTLAHSITLVISAAGILRLPSRFVETAIALSVVAAAMNNLLRTVDARWAVAFALGLLHGFGFSSVLIDLGLPSHELIGALLGFNCGVEIGQAAIVLAMLPVLYLIRRTWAYQALLWGGSGVVAVVAAIWAYHRWFI